MQTLVSNFRHAVNEQLQQRVSNQAPFPLVAHPNSFRIFITPAQKLLNGGKRTRALLLAGGWQAFNTNDSLSLPVCAGTALELYQASALVHDDIIDEATTRRNIPAIHHLFSHTHTQANLSGSASDFGKKSAILLGDYLLSLAGLCFEDAEHISLAAFHNARRMFHTMTAEVAFGQFLDNTSDYTPLATNLQQVKETAFSVIYHKTARYSVDYPVKIGAALAGADPNLLPTLSAFTIPLGEAFQLRDDLLSIFGDPQLTGKPACHDITEGKKTVALATALELSSPRTQDVLRGFIGKELDSNAVTTIRDIFQTSGALSKVEQLITEREEQAQQALATLPHNATLLKYCLDFLQNRVS